jgi:glycine/D-amino acid oxidase-like deaminating enzyme
MNKDVLVIGAGVIGLSSAIHIKRLNPKKSVTVIDRLSGPGQGNTAKAAGIYLNLHTTKVNYLLADSTIDWFYYLQNTLSYSISLHQYGYLYLLDSQRYEKLKRALPSARALGVEVETFEVEELKQFLPDLNFEFDDEEINYMGLTPISGGVFGVRCGNIDPDALAKSLEIEFIKLGGEIFYNTEVKELVYTPKKELGLPGEPYVWQDFLISGVKTNRGNIDTDTTIIAAGTWSERLLAPLGFDPLMRPKNRVIFVFDNHKLKRLRMTSGFSDMDSLPFTQIPGISTYLKSDPSEGTMWLGCADDLRRSYGLEDDPKPEKGLYEDNIYHALVKYLPCFEGVRPVNSWAGQRAVNMLDRTPVVAPGPGIIYVGSASGYGITKSDSLGRVVAAVYGGEKEAELFGGRSFRVSDIGIERRNVGRELFKV